MSQERRGQIAIGTLLAILGTGLTVATINITGFFNAFARIGEQDTEIATTKLEIVTMKDDIREIKELNYLILQEISPNTIYKYKQSSYKTTSTIKQ